MEIGVIGIHTATVMFHVVVEHNQEVESVITLLLPMVVMIVLVKDRKYDHATPNLVQQQQQQHPLPLHPVSLFKIL